MTLLRRQENLQYDYGYYAMITLLITDQHIKNIGLLHLLRFYARDTRKT